MRQIWLQWDDVPAAAQQGYWMFVQSILYDAASSKKGEPVYHVQGHLYVAVQKLVATHYATQGFSLCMQSEHRHAEHDAQH